MKAWTRWRESLRRAEEWDSPSPKDSQIRQLKALFEAVPEDDPHADSRLWWRLRHSLDRPEARAAETPSLGAALAAIGPRFMAGAFAGAALVGALYLTQAGPVPVQEPALYAMMTSLESSAAPFGPALEAPSADDLLGFIAYSGPAR